MDKLPNPPAFPVPASKVSQGGDGYITGSPQEGMTLLDYFAGRALAGMIAATEEDADYPDPDKAAATAYEYATAMLEARKKELDFLAECDEAADTQPGADK